MDKGLKHGTVLKTELERPPSPRQARLAKQRDFEESNSESFTQEKAYQQQLHMRTGSHENKYILPRTENADSLKRGDGEKEDANDNETEDLQIYDSLEVESHPHGKMSLTLLPTQYLDTQLNEREGTSQLISDDAYSDLRYDPNWRTNLKRNGRFSESPRISIEEYYPEETSSQSCADIQGLEISGGYRYITDTIPAVVVTPHVADSESDQPYHLHPQDGQTSSVTSLHCHKHTLQLRSSEGDFSRSSSFSTNNESDSILQRGFREEYENSCDIAENISTSPELTEDIQAIEFQTCYEEELRHTQGGSIQTQKMSISTLTSPEVVWNRKLERLTKDIVERNKITLGRNTSKCGSYMKVHALKQGMAHNVNKVHESVKETASAENQEDSSDPGLRGLQKTQQLQVTQISKGKKAERKENPNPSQQQHPRAPGVRTEQGDSLNSPLARPVAVTPSKAQKMTSSQPLPPTIHLNISLNTSSHPLSLLQQKGQDAIINLASLCGHPHWSYAPKFQLALPSGYQQTDPGKSSNMSQERLNTQLHHRNLESSPDQCQRMTTLKLPSSCDGEDQNWSSNEVHTKQVPQNLPRTPTTTSSQGLGSYTVLPPIGKPTSGKEHELSPGLCVNTAYRIHRSSSDGYLSQMEKQKWLRARVTYKAYSLKDYKQLKPDINLGGLGPDYTAFEKTKMKRQKLYSNVICEQNKKISRIPFLLAKDLEGNDKKVPRTKALEYAKTIAKPLIRSQPKQRQKQQSEGFTQHAPYLQDLDVSQLGTLELLRKRHEEEKQAVAQFRKVHAV